MMNYPGALNVMLPYGLCGPTRPRIKVKIPRVVTDQKTKFIYDELFQTLTDESEIRYSGYSNLPQPERRNNFIKQCREGQTEIVFVISGTPLYLAFKGKQEPSTSEEGECHFKKDTGKAHITSHLIMNGVCVKFRGWLHLDSLVGAGCLEYDEKRALEEEAILHYQLGLNSSMIRDFENNQRANNGEAPEHYVQLEAVRRYESIDSAASAAYSEGGMW